MREVGSRVGYIESKAGTLNGPARIGRAAFPKTGRRLYYKDHEYRDGHGIELDFFEVETGDEYWISGPRRMARTAVQGIGGSQLDAAQPETDPPPKLL